MIKIDQKLFKEISKERKIKEISKERNIKEIISKDFIIKLPSPFKQWTLFSIYYKVNSPK